VSIPRPWGLPIGSSTAQAVYTFETHTSQDAKRGSHGAVSVITRGPMKVQDGSSSKTAVPGTPSSSKKPYQKPAFRHEKVFETMALACGKIDRVQGQCHFGTRKNS
jgi:hypothetical protein